MRESNYGGLVTVEIEYGHRTGQWYDQGDLYILYKPYYVIVATIGGSLYGLKLEM